MHIKVLGKGCAKCQKLEDMVQQTLQRLGQQAQVEKVTDYPTILAYGVSNTPALVVNERLVLAGRLPHGAELEGWLKA